MSISALGLDSFDWFSPVEAEDVDSFVGDAEQTTHISPESKRLLHIPPVNEKQQGEKHKERPAFKKVKLKRKLVTQLESLIGYVKDLNRSLANYRTNT